MEYDYIIFHGGLDAWIPLGIWYKALQQHHIFIRESIVRASTPQIPSFRKELQPHCPGGALLEQTGAGTPFQVYTGRFYSHVTPLPL